MRPLGKIITAGVAIVMGTSLLTGVTTAYMLRPAPPAQSMTAASYAAGLGAAGGAIANGGSGAGKGALIGGRGGAATGAGYGAYKTNNDCGTIFGNRGFTDAVPGVAARGPVTQTALRPGADDITIYSVR
jgi:hypothetical protein